MKKILFILLFLSLSISLFAFGEKNIILDFTKVIKINGTLKDNIITFDSTGEISCQLNLLKNRVYNLNIECDNLNCDANIVFLYKYANVGEINKPILNKQVTFSSPVRFDNTKLTLKIKEKCTISKITIDVEPEPLVYGYFVTPQFKNIVTPNISNLYYRYISNHEELGKNDKDLNLSFSIKDNNGNIKWTKTQKNPSAKSFCTFSNPKLDLGNYTFCVELKEKDTSLGSYSTDYIVSNITDTLYPDGNGRLWWKGKLFILLGIMGNYDKSKDIGLNSYIENNSLFINGEDSKIGVFLPQGKINNDTFKDFNKNTLTICDNIDYTTYPIMNSGYFGLNLKENIYNDIKAFFDDYGFYFPLINVINVDENLDRNFWENFAQTQTGLIFNLKNPSDMDKIKPYVDFVKKYENIILSNEEYKTYVFGNIKYLIRHIDKVEYVFLFETRNKECEVDIVVPNKKNKVSEGDTILSPNKKDKKKYSLMLKPNEMKIIKIEL